MKGFKDWGEGEGRVGGQKLRRSVGHVTNAPAIWNTVHSVPHKLDRVIL